MRFLNVFLAAFLIMSCNDTDNKYGNKLDDLFKKDENEQNSDQKLVQCFTLDNLKKECLIGKWKIKSAKQGEKNQTLEDLILTAPQKIQSLDLKSDKISGKIFLVKADAIALRDNALEIPQTTYSFEEGSKKISFNGPSGIPMNLIVKLFKNKEMTLELSGKTIGIPAKDYVLETVWSKE
ncbi:MAG: hypothetical protein ACMUEM_02465 [Flavobacteriales bacterium AspAUS03]